MAGNGMRLNHGEEPWPPWPGLLFALVAVPASVLLANYCSGCALDTSVPEAPARPLRWSQSSLEVCAATEYRPALEAASEAWRATAAPRLRSGCESPDIVIGPHPADSFPKADTLAHTTVDAAGDSMVSAVIDIAQPWPSGWDLQSTITHELGHALGLGHIRDSAATMGEWQRDQYDTSWRDLAPSDIEAARTLYH